MPPRTAQWPRSSTLSTRRYPAAVSEATSPSTPGSLPTSIGTLVGSVDEIGQPLRQRDRRRTHEPARGEQLERAKALADEMGRRLEPRGLGDAPAGVERNRLRPEEPRRTLGRVARVRVLGEKDEKPPPELGVESGENERKRCLRHPRAGGKRLRVGEEPVAPAKLVDERRERHDGVREGLVHASGGNEGPRGHRRPEPCPFAQPSLPCPQPPPGAPPVPLDPG